MRFGVLGTGMVGRAIAGRLVGLDHDVMIGTRDVQRTQATSGSDRMGNPPFSTWQRENPDVKLGTFAQAAAHGEVIVNATNGAASIEALKLAGEGNLRGKTLIDISNPLDFSKGMPPTLSVSNPDSLGEQIQRAFPQTHVVKTLNTVNAYRAAAQFWMEGYCRHRRYHDRARPRDVSSHLAAPLGSCEDPDVQYKSRSLKRRKRGAPFQGAPLTKRG